MSKRTDLAIEYRLPMRPDWQHWEYIDPGTPFPLAVERTQRLRSSYLYSHPTMGWRIVRTVKISTDVEVDESSIGAANRGGDGFYVIESRRSGRRWTHSYSFLDNASPVDVRNGLGTARRYGSTGEVFRLVWREELVRRDVLTAF